MTTTANPAVTLDITRKFGRTMKHSTRLGNNSPTTVNYMLSAHCSIMYALLNKYTTISDISQDVAYTIEKKAVRHDDASEEVDNVNYHHPSSN